MAQALACVQVLGNTEVALVMCRPSHTQNKGLALACPVVTPAPPGAGRVVGAVLAGALGGSSAAPSPWLWLFLASICPAFSGRPRCTQAGKWVAATASANQARLTCLPHGTP